MTASDKSDRVSELSEWTRQDLDDFARRHRYRRPLGWLDANIIGAVAIVSLTWPPMGVAFAIRADDLAGRLEALGASAVGAAIGFLAVRYLRRPVRPHVDEDFERELRHKGLKPGRLG